MSERIKLILKEHGGIILITLLAAVFRFAFFDLTIYWHDQSRSTFQALQILEEGQWPVAGPETRILLPHPPLMAYIQVFSFLIYRSPLAVQGFITSLNLLAVPLTYFTALRLFERRTALSAAFIYAISPLAVYFSQRSSAPGLLEFFTSLMAYLLFPALIEQKDRGVFLGLSVAGLMAQTYLQAYAVVFQLGLLLLAFGRHISWRPVLLGGIFFVLVSSPYAYFAITRSEESISRLSKFLSQPVMVDAQALSHAFRLVSGDQAVEHAEPLPIARMVIGQQPRILSQAATWALSLLLVLGIAEAGMRVLRGAGSSSYLILLIWFFAPVILMSIHTIEVDVNYLLLTMPAGFILVGLGPHHLWRFPRLVPLLALALIFIYGQNMLLTYSQIAQHPNVGTFEWLRPRFSLPIGQVIRENTREVYMKVTHEWISAVSGTLVKPYTAFEEDLFLVLRANRPALYVLLDPKHLSPAFSFAQELTEKKIDLSNDGSIRFFLFPSRTKEQLASLPSHSLNLQLDMGWSLLGYDLPDTAHAGDTVPFTSYWLVEALPPNRHSLFYKPFAHLLDPMGEVITISGGHGQAGNLWRRGDLYIDTLQIPIPKDLIPGQYWLYTGLYDPNTSIRALFPGGEDYILVGPVRIE